jgi:hypothetical protein
MLVPALEMAVNGDLFAIDRVLKIMDRRAKYLGLDMSTGREGEGSTPEEFRALMVGFSAFLPPPPGSCGHGSVDDEGSIVSLTNEQKS